MRSRVPPELRTLARGKARLDSRSAPTIDSAPGGTPLSADALESTIREAYAAFGPGDLDGYLRASTKDFTFNIPGRGAIAGAFRGAQGLQGLARKAVEGMGAPSEKTSRMCW
jgi:hypothetical protein